MAVIRIDNETFDADMVAFDKDGTLIEFDVMWGRLAEAWMDGLAGETNMALRSDLCHSLGYDPDQRRTLPQSPLSIAKTGQLLAIVADTLYRHGIPWPEAQDRTQDVFDSATADLPLAGLVSPAGDVLGLFAQLHQVGVRVAVVTTDGRAETEEALHLLHVAPYVDHLVCGDDGFPSKPAPDMVLAACQRLGVDPSRTVVVGDTQADLLMAQRAGVGLRVAVLSGPADPGLLAAHADVVIQSIDDISVAEKIPS
jgi:HAD superfamily hydrolase (TIGR01509 family)